MGLKIIVSVSVLQSLTGQLFKSRAYTGLFTFNTIEGKSCSRQVQNSCSFSGMKPKVIYCKTYVGFTQSPQTQNNNNLFVYYNDMPIKGRGSLMNQDGKGQVTTKVVTMGNRRILCGLLLWNTYKEELNPLIIIHKKIHNVRAKLQRVPIKG